MASALLSDILLRYASSLLFLLATTFAGVFLADILFSLGFHRKIGRPLRPLLKSARLPEELSVPIITGMIDSRAEHAIVSSLVRSEALSHREAVCYSLISLPFGGSRLMIQYVLPVAIAGLGPVVGTIYVALSILGLFIGMIIGVIGGRIFLTEERRKITLEDEIQGRKVDIRRSLLKAASMTKNVGVKYVIVVIILSILIYFGMFDYLKSLSTPLAKAFFVSPVALPITITYAVNSMAAVLMAGEFIRGGIVMWKDALIALFVGRVIFAIISEFPRHSFPFYVSIYQPKLALKLTLALIFYTLISTPLLVLAVRILPVV
ncbi:hypothetical protein D6D85_13875 [Candidatus Methanodesulfokora washburnensis]|uniref:Nucleoside recognition protein n=2 Tax=Candidatus Methanodesulfokora washburnensis TaxID=2478471 RepID=A0A3R9X0N8_9CREN|nr:hypothetical protein D6D85_13875 [Candidatus Methanodesulfokores washburnensis]